VILEDRWRGQIADGAYSDWPEIERFVWALADRVDGVSIPNQMVSFNELIG